MLQQRVRGVADSHQTSCLSLQHRQCAASGFFFVPSFMATLDAFGADRLLYSVDYPFGSLERGRAFLEEIPVDAQTLSKIAHRNADQLLKFAA